MVAICLDFSQGVTCRSLLKHASPAAFANRAMVRLKKDNWEGAEADCSAALELDSLYLKAWQRRGTARRALKKLLEAAQDFEEALRQGTCPFAESSH